MKPMRINIVLGPFHPTLPGPAGAIEKRWQGVAEHFAAAGHQVTLMSRCYEDLPRDETRNGVRHIRRGGFTRTNRRVADLMKDMAYSWRILLALPRADVTITNVFWLPPMLKKLRPGVGRVAVNVARYPKNQMWLYDGVDGLVAVSQAVADEIVRQRPKLADRVSVVPNPVDIHVFKPVSSPPPGDRRVLMYHGRVHPEKGVHMLVDAFAKVAARHKDLRLRIVGPVASERGGGGESYLSDLRRRIGDLPVELVEPISEPAELAAALQQVDYYCYPSLADFGESFGVAPLEAMAVGLVPVVSDLACFRDFIQHGVNGFVFDHRADDAVDRLATALEWVIDGAAELQDMRQAAVDTARRFSNEAIAEAYLTYFRRMCEDSSS